MAIYRRVGITRAKSILGKSGVDTLLGWDALVNELLEDRSKHDLLYQSLMAALKDLLMYGSRLFECYELASLDTKQLCKILDDKNPKQFSIEPLVNIDSYRPSKEFELFAREESKNTLTYYFLHYAECTERVVLEKDAIKDTYCYEEGFDKIIATTTGKKIFINTLRIERDLGKLYVMIDRADEVGLINLRKVKGTFIDKINALYESSNGNLFFQNKINLLDKVEALYDDDDLGIVDELKFLCPSGTLRHEKLSRKESAADLRYEVYHKAGMEEIDYIIEPFYISMKFNFGQLSLLGRSSMINNSRKRPLTEGVLRQSFSCNNYSSLLKVLDDA